MIHGNGVTLRPFSLDDLKFLHRWNNDPEYVGAFEPFEPITEDELRKWLRKPDPHRSWHIIQTEEGEKIGQLVVTEKGEKTVQLGYRMVPKYRNKGHCTEAVRTIVHHLFVETDTVRVIAEANPENTASLRVLEKAGFTRVGYKERSVELDGRWLDGYIYELRRG